MLYKLNVILKYYYLTVIDKHLNNKNKPEYITMKRNLQNSLRKMLY